MKINKKQNSNGNLIVLMTNNNNKKIDTKALRQWNKSSISYENYQDFLDKKKDRYKLTIIDLFYISNFKGGNATINEPEKVILKKLINYSNLLFNIKSHFEEKKLVELNKSEIEILITNVNKILELAGKTNENKIDGFGISFLTALMNSYFPNLIPILDRRVIINLGLVSTLDIYKSGQIKNIEKFYPKLIKVTAKNCRKHNLTLREFDQKTFAVKFTTIN